MANAGVNNHQNVFNKNNLYANNNNNQAKGLAVDVKPIANKYELNAQK